MSPRKKSDQADDRRQKQFPKTKIEYASTLGYLNMKETLKDYPQLTDYAIEAAKRAGIKAELRPIRGGTDGSRLTAMGLPTPNLFTGGHNFHGKLEFNSRKGLERSTETLAASGLDFPESTRDRDSLVI